MRSISPSSAGAPRQTRTHAGWKTGAIRPFVLVVGLITLSIVAGAAWYFGSARSGKLAADPPEPDIRLSDGTRTVLKRLKSPVEIRFYSLLDEAENPGSLVAYAGRVDRLLAAYVRDSDARIKVTRHTSGSEADLNAAAADGIGSFNLDQGKPCYLGLGVSQGDQQESLPRLAPEWEQALEADLTRTILRVTGARTFAAQAAATAQADSAASAELKRSIPNFDALTMEEVRKILRERAFKALEEAKAATQTQVAQAQQQLNQAVGSKSKAEQEAAIEQVRQAQAAQVDQLKEIAARLQTELTLLELLKGTPSPSSPKE